MRAASSISKVSGAGISRRQLIKTGFLGSALLTVSSGMAVLTGCSSRPPRPLVDTSGEQVYRFLNKEDVALVVALLPVVVGDTWPSQTGARRQAELDTLPRVDLFVSRMGDFNRQEVRQLFDLLHIRLTRGLTTGLWSSWESQSEQDIEAFFSSWQHSSLDLFRSAHNALADILGFAWYSNPMVSKPLGFSGVKPEIAAALPQFASREEGI